MLFSGLILPNYAASLKYAFSAENSAGIIRQTLIPGNFSDVKTLANVAFSLKLQVANLVLHCNASTRIKVCTLKNEKLAKTKRRNRLIFGKC